MSPQSLLVIAVVSYGYLPLDPVRIHEIPV